MDQYPKARKDHKCDECGSFIRKGVVYHKQTGIFDNEPYTWKVHKDCAQLYFKMNADSGSWIDEQIRLSEFNLDEIQWYRGYFPHAICRFEFIAGESP
jgi:hypothetical protein